jgi:hypothetical protein
MFRVVEWAEQPTNKKLIHLYKYSNKFREEAIAYILFDTTQAA